MTARDEYGDKVRAAEVADEWDATDADRRSNQPRTRRTRPKTDNGAPPVWADEYPEVEW
jgi:hypothetical protein